MSTNKKHPKILYWFWDEHTVVDKQYMKDIERIKNETPFDLLFFTARGTLNFYGDRDILVPAFQEVSEYAHANDLKIGLQLWRDESNIQKDEALALLVEEERLLSSTGKAHYVSKKRGARQSDGLCSEIYSAYVFDKVGSGTYVPGSLEEVTDKCKVEVIDEETVIVDLDLGEEYGGKTVYFLVAHYCKSPDLYSDYYERSFTDILSHYSEVDFDGVGLDEFKSMNITYAVMIFQTGKRFRERLYGKSFAKLFEEQRGFSLKQAVLEMRYVAKGEEYKRMRAINYYFDTLKDNVIKVENFVAKKAKETYGEDIFLGLHNTYHNSIGKDEIWQTGCMWWDLPREYGQTDEHIAYPVRLGIMASYNQNIVYDMFYEQKEADFIYQKALLDARYNSRIHYHAYNDVRPHRFDLNNDECLKNLSNIEGKISLLDEMERTIPKSDVLIVFGRPSLVNWYPKEQFRDDYDINIEPRVMEKCKMLWENKIIGTLVPSTKIESGMLKIAEDGSINYNGHTYSSLLYIAPEYSTKKAIEFLLACAKNNLTFIDGELTHDFDGDCAKEAFEQLKKDAKVFEFCIPRMLEEGMTQSMMFDGSVMENGTVVLTNADSVLFNRKEKFVITVADKTYSGEYIGLVAVHADEATGELLEFVCGNSSDLYCNGEKILDGNGEDIVYIK
ncbi:MAG: hypothetical protein R3Y47_00800 [Lachnospiraceae bacterium]